MSDERLTQRARDLGRLVQEILKQFQQLHDVAACGPDGNLSPQELRVVECLGESGPRMMRALAEYLGLAVNSMTSVIDHLEQKGLVQRARSAVDRRVVHVELTGEGKRIFEVASQAKLAFHRAVLAVLTEDEQEIWLLLFRKIAREGWTQVARLAAAEVA
jgi:DNA-binding MarR family transcriptional regulator